MARRARKLTPDRSARHRFGADLRRHREAAGMTLEKLAEAVCYSRSHLARIETAEHVPPPDLPTRLDKAFGTGERFARLYVIARHEREIHPEKYRRRMDLETRARVIDEYAGQLVPGLVQTEAYARALFRVSNPRATPAEIERLVSARMNRQALLQATAPPYMSMILDEAVIRRPVGGPAVMRAQLNRLIELVDTGTTVVQVLPFTHGEHALMGGVTTLMKLDDGSSIAYEESAGAGTILEDPPAVQARGRAYALLTAYALSPKQTAALMKEAMEGLPA
ncbi:helix-turn-helix domain-containing protein [Streptomyces telluris]|uniref:Helix-turn-helix domain-containing protein n=1 Tax=Streptomyces telluris TaxID=2720021 RepID=A0A9X2LCX1_9ACTN|nr:helix-turn-helix transcriptional regulator [Streptomyces telluris]MCQ8768816.1 helix-turn-helix domain-containing protein [Streptomyces telluris]NJP78429.1 helix-turn-helix domain-containing protein [Streptomyces telluris]